MKKKEIKEDVCESRWIGAVIEQTSYIDRTEFRIKIIDGDGDSWYMATHTPSSPDYKAIVKYDAGFWKNLFGESITNRLMNAKNACIRDIEDYYGEDIDNINVGYDYEWVGYKYKK